MSISLACEFVSSPQALIAARDQAWFGFNFFAERTDTPLLEFSAINRLEVVREAQAFLDELPHYFCPVI